MTEKPMPIDREPSPTPLALLYDEYAAQLFRTALSLTGSRELAEDAVQEVFVGLAGREESLPHIGNLKSYLFTALRNSAWRQKSRWRHRPLPENREAAAMNPEASETAVSSRLEKALGLLPEEQRQAVLLKIDGELTFAEIAETLGVSQHTAASRYRYAMEKLKQWMKLWIDSNA